MYKRHRFLLGLIDFLGDRRRLDQLTLVKIAFLLAKEHPPSFAMYGFYPYDYGPFSREIYLDIEYFTEQGFLQKQENDKKVVFSVTISGKDQEELSDRYKNIVSSYLKRFPTTSDLLDYVYERFPKYTIRSRRGNRTPNPMTGKPGFLLVGYEGRSIDEFLFLLITNGVQILADVRANPHSMKYHFNKGRLERTLQSVDITYQGFPSLGIPSQSRQNLQGPQDYEMLFQQYRKELPNKQTELNRLAILGQNARVCLMCFEQDYNSCHRRELGQYLKRIGYPVGII